MSFSVSHTAALELISSRVVDLSDAGNLSPIILIDGRAGSGKTTLAGQLQNQLFRSLEVAPRVIHMDDLYEGWDGLQAGSDYLVREILGPLIRGKNPSWQEYDWAIGERKQWREFAGSTPLIVEGCGSLSRATAELAHLKVWLEVDQLERHRRWLIRDGHKFDDQWPIWAAQEAEFYGKEHSPDLADFVVTN